MIPVSPVTWQLSELTQVHMQGNSIVYTLMTLEASSNPNPVLVGGQYRQPLLTHRLLETMCVQECGHQADVPKEGSMDECWRK